MADLMSLDAAVIERLSMQPMTERALSVVLDEPKASVAASLRRLVDRHMVTVAPRDWHPVVRWTPKREKV